MIVLHSPHPRRNEADIIAKETEPRMLMFARDLRKSRRTTRLLGFGPEIEE
jgi:hypothetical protein